MATPNQKKQLYILAIDNPELERLEVQYMPKLVNYKRNANIQRVDIVGRNDKLNQYKGGDTSISLTLDFFAVEQGFEDAKRKINWLKSMTYSNEDAPPSRIKLIFGDLFDNEIWILKSVGVKYSSFQPANGWLPRHASASLSFVLDTNFDLFAEQIRTGNF